MMRGICAPLPGGMGSGCSLAFVPFHVWSNHGYGTTQSGRVPRRAEPSAGHRVPPGLAVQRGR